MGCIKTGEYKICPICKTQFYVKHCHIIAGQCKYCSLKCANASRKGIIPKNLEYARSKSPIKKGHHLSFMRGNTHWNWNEENPSYRAVHDWIVKKYGNATKCENKKCVYPRKDMRGNLMLKPKEYQWANISGKYRRNINDFRQLCASCHKLFDMGNAKLKVVF